MLLKLLPCFHSLSVRACAHSRLAICVPKEPKRAAVERRLHSFARGLVARALVWGSAMSAAGIDAVHLRLAKLDLGPQAGPLTLEILSYKKIICENLYHA